MIHRLICFLIFTKNLKPDYTIYKMYPSLETPAEKIINKVQSLYFNEYFHNIIYESGGPEKLVLVSAVAYDSCNKYSGKTINGTSGFFKNKFDDVETYISKTVATVEDDYPVPYSTPPFDVVELYKGNSIPNEEKVLEYYDYDKCIVYNYNYDKCDIDINL